MSTNPTATSREPERCYIGRYSTREQAEQISARYGDTAYPNRTVEPQEIGGRTDWLIWCDRGPLPPPNRLLEDTADGNPPMPL